jgi:hypothetical protein
MEPESLDVSRTLSLTFQSQAETVRRDAAVGRAVIAGWTGRDRDAVEKHIAELEKLGVKRPATTPIFYRVSAARLTTDPAIEVTGTTSSGEVEFVLLQSGGRLWVGVGSDHTDREVEAYGVTVSKQMCDKPIAPVFWPYDEVAPHWDRLLLRSYAVENGARSLYQDGPVAAMLAPSELLQRFGENGTLAEGTLMFCGTLATHGGVKASERFEFEIEDPLLGRTIRHGYDVSTLPVLG